MLTKYRDIKTLANARSKAEDVVADSSQISKRELDRSMRREEKEKKSCTIELEGALAPALLYTSHSSTPPLLCKYKVVAFVPLHIQQRADRQPFPSVIGSGI